MRTLKTTVEYDDPYIIIRRVRDNLTVKLSHIGRCWCLFFDDDSVDIAGSLSSEDSVVRAVRRWLRQDELPIMDIHCTGW